MYERIDPFYSYDAGGVALDWEPLARPKPEHAEEFAALLARLQATGDESVLDRMNAISTAAFETLGAPRVGFDDAADEWLRAKVGDDDFYDMSMKMHGWYVLDLLPACDGFPFYSSHRGWPKLDRYSFSGSFLMNARDELGALLFEAFRYMSAEQLEDYGERLLACARRFARERRIMEVELVDLPDFEKGSPEARAHVMFAGGRWCLYWARRGHGLAPWF